MLGCGQPKTMQVPLVPQWTTHEIVLTSDVSYDNGYTDVDVSITFTNGEGVSLWRPAFWDGGDIWRVRFAPPDTGGLWHWTSTASDAGNVGLHGQTGDLRSISYDKDNRLIRHGLLRMSEGKRNVIHQDGTPFLVVGDTPWSIPFRATTEQVLKYAKDRQSKGFNAALLMTVQPDTKAEGPEARNVPKGFMRGFADLSDGHINLLNPPYYQYLDSLTDILLAHEIVPVYQPVFHGYGWKGKEVLGKKVITAEYVRYCQYLLARYGSKPAFWLLAGDNNAKDPGVKESGEMMEKWDCYQQPTGLHYNPCDDYIAEWALDRPEHCNHGNKTHQDEPWLDFQWAQTGHGGEHLYHKVERMYDNQPTKAVANGEPTYEGMNGGANGLGWWQGEEAWMQLMSGGTMGVVYGAACLWQWKVTPDEEGWPKWTDQPLAWYQALELKGSNYVGYVSKAFAGYDFTDMEKCFELTGGNQPLLCNGKRFYVSYLANGGSIEIDDVPAGIEYRWFDPKAGVFADQGESLDGKFSAPDDRPWVLMVGNRDYKHKVGR